MTAEPESLDYASLSKLLSPSKREELEKAVSSALFSVLGTNNPESTRNKILENENKRLKEDNEVKDIISDVAENAIFESRWSTNKMVNLGKRIKNLENEEGKDSIYRIRMSLWLTAKRIGLSKEEKKEFKKLDRIDINKGYKIISQNLMKKMEDSTNDKEKISIRAIMKYINKYHKEYSMLNNVTEFDRIENMRKIDSGIRKAA